MEIEIKQGDVLRYGDRIYTAGADGLKYLGSFSKDEVCAAVCSVFGVTMTDVRRDGHDHGARLDARQCLCHLLTRYTHMSKTDVGKVVGRTHATIIHHANLWQSFTETYPEYRGMELQVMNILATMDN